MEEISCPFCEETFRAKDQLKCHLKVTHLAVSCNCHYCHDFTYYSCDICLQQFENQPELNEHRIQCHKDVLDSFKSDKIVVIIYKCDICDGNFEDVTDLRNHKLTCEKNQFEIDGLLTPENSFLKCDICDKLCENEENLKIHKQEFHSEQNVTFSITNVHSLEPEIKKRGRIFATSTPIVTNNVTKNVKCHLCDKEFDMKMKLKVHFYHKHKRLLQDEELMISHDTDLGANLDQLKCDVCEEEFLQADDYMIHKFSAHQNEDKNTQEGLQIPQNENKTPKKATNSKTFDCSKCQKSFDKRIRLQIHQKKTHKLDELKCDICQKSFKFLSKLKSHLKAKHLNKHSSKIVVAENSKKCEICQKSFATTQGLKLHKTRFCGSKTLRCHGCSKFVKSGDFCMQCQNQFTPKLILMNVADELPKEES